MSKRQWDCPFFDALQYFNLATQTFPCCRNGRINQQEYLEPQTKERRPLSPNPLSTLVQTETVKKVVRLMIFLTRPFILTFFVISKTCAFPSRFVFSHFFVVSPGVANDTTNHFRMISALGGGISFLVLNRILSCYPFFTSIFCSLKVWCDVSLFS